MDSAVSVRWTSVDGEEHEEDWPSAGRFLTWAASAPHVLEYTIYAADEDGDLVVVDRGRGPG